VNTIDPDFFVNERKRSATNPTESTVLIVYNSALISGGCKFVRHPTIVHNNNIIIEHFYDPTHGRIQNLKPDPIVPDTRVTYARLSVGRQTKL